MPINNKKLKFILLIIPLLVTLVLKAQAYNLPDIGSSTNSALSYKDERMLGEYIYSDLQKELPLVSDPLIEDYIQKLGTKLVNNSNKHFDNFKFFVVDSPEINAFALPGGYIAVNRGLITTADSESEIAAVLAHEITHVNQRHIARSFEKQQQLQLPMLAGIIAGALVTAYNPAAGQSIIAGSMAASGQSMINYTRSNEEEADRIGMSVLTKSGYSPYSMGDFFKKLQRNAYADKDNYPEYLRTHPMTNSRTADSNSRSDDLLISNNKNKNFSLNKNSKTISNSNNFDFMLIKIMAANNKNNNVKSAFVILDQQASQDISNFKTAYSQLKNREGKQELTIFQELYNKYPNNQIITSLYTEALEKQPQVALNILSNYLKSHPKNIPISIQYATLAIRNNNTEKAVAVLKNITQSHTNNNYPAKINLLLAEGYNKLDQKWQASLAYSDYSVQKGDLTAAIMQLKSTVKFNKLSDYQLKIINYRIKNLEAAYNERKEQLKAWI